MDFFSPVLTILSAMITPVVLISACASLILSTSNRANRVVDRLYDWSAEFSRLVEEPVRGELIDEQRAMTFEQLDFLTSRARLLQRCLSACHIALGLFVATSVTIGVAGVAWIFAREYVIITALPIVLSMIGAGYLLYASFLLILEARLALKTTDREMDFVWYQGKRQASPELLEWRQRMRRQSASPLALLRRRSPGHVDEIDDAIP
jgi:hypothetical protein